MLDVIATVLYVFLLILLIAAVIGLCALVIIWSPLILLCSIPLVIWVAKKNKSDERKED